MAIVPFPNQLARYTEGWRLVNAVRGGVASLVGNQQFVISAASRWEGKLGFYCRRPTDFTEADGFLAALDGPANSFLCGPADWRGRPWNVLDLTGAEITPAMARAARKKDTGYDTNPETTGNISFVLAQDVPINAVNITVHRNLGGKLRRGQYFSMGNRLHIIAALTSADSIDPATGRAVPGNVEVTIRPWTRVAYPAGTVLDFAEPLGLMRLTAESASLVERTSTPLSELPLTITEYF